MLRSSDSSCILFSREDFKKLFGRDFDKNTDVVLVMNGEGKDIPVHVDGCQYLGDSGAIYVTFDRGWYQNIRINYLVAMA